MGEGVYIEAAILTGCNAEMKAASKIAWRKCKEEGKNLGMARELRGQAAMIFNGKARTIKGSSATTREQKERQGPRTVMGGTVDSADGSRRERGAEARQAMAGRP
jgi:hypothetical protein